MYELFWAGEPHTAGTGFWVETLEPFAITCELYEDRVDMGQNGEERFAFETRQEAQREIDNLNSQLEAYQSKQLSLNIKGAKG